MSLLQVYKNSLTSQRSDILANFTRFRSIRAFMAVYHVSANKVFLTFSSSNNFENTQKVGKAVLARICVFNCATDFDTQFNAFLLA
jgi:hypothetical protein